MTITFRLARAHLETFDFKSLFVEELGWARTVGHWLPMEVDGEKYRLTPIAELAGMVVYECESQSPAYRDLPPANVRKKIDRDVTKLSFEHIIIFVDAARTKAAWLWVKREPGKAAKAREQTYQRGQPGDRLLQKLAGIAFDLSELDEEGQASIADVAGRVARAFDVERVTKRFYDEFKLEHTAFLQFIKGIESDDDRAWYTSVMLNRLMFIYFIQKKGFLDDDQDYLQHRLAASKTTGRNRFYLQFLATLFFEGFAREEDQRSPEARKLLGRIPYLNGGLFLPHQLELRFGKAIQIPDAVFERLLDFFDRWDWHLDVRPLRAGNEINPDVLGYIFEKYINQKQMGAYYTKEDITGYICRYTILPFLFDKLGTLRPMALETPPFVDIEPYIYPSVKEPDYLPTETGRERAARHKRLAQIRADFKEGKIARIDDLVTYNLDLERFAQEYLRALDDPETLHAYYFECLVKLSVLDPTVGSGAFLFAAMNILEPLYEICLDRMAHWAGPKFPEFKAELERVAGHPNRRYFIFKSIIVNNLYGVDIMEEATEICKLRLFLKLVAQIDEVAHVEPLPDIDFNIRAGNTLVGYASVAEVEQAATRSIFNVGLPEKIKAADAALRAFRRMQTLTGITAKALAKAKSDTLAKLDEIERLLNEALRSEYGARKLETFVASHLPFHWYVGFNQVMQAGGFDIIVGNPPYVEYSKVRGEYQVRGYQTEECGNLYAFVMERSYALWQRNGRLGLIIPVSSFATDRMQSLQTVSRSACEVQWISSFEIRPSKLFEGSDQRLSIVISRASPGPSPSAIYTTKYHRWYREERPHLLAVMGYQDATPYISRFGYPKIGTAIDLAILDKLPVGTLEQSFDEESEDCVYWHRIPRYFIKAVDFVPYFRSNREGKKKSEDYKLFKLRRRADKNAVLTLLNSSLFYWYWSMFSEGYHCGKHEVLAFPADLDNLPSAARGELAQLARQLMSDLKANARRTVRSQKTTNVEYSEFYASLSKPILDEIDRVWARHYGLTEQQLDYILNYDVKYRMGKDEAVGEGAD
jgi:hypothetical protein